MDVSPFHLGFACVWDAEPAKTWSGTPSHLLQALESQRQTSVHNVNCALAPSHKRLFQALGMGFQGGKRVSRYRFLPSYIRAVEKQCEREVRRVQQQQQARRNVQSSSIDAMLQIGDIAALQDIPTFTYQDVAVHYLLQSLRQKGKPVPMFAQYREKELVRRWERQARYYAECAGIFTMSDWLKNYLVTNNLAPADKIHTVHAGTNVPPMADKTLFNKASSEKKTILFVGRDFERKGGDVVVQAFIRLQRQFPQSVRLVIAGPQRWENCATGLAAVPEGIEFLGDADYSTLRGYFSTADVFCMPSRFEAFGIVFVEALSNGVPCIGRNCYAMPEIITHGQNGYLLDENAEGSEAASQLASLLAAVLENRTMKTFVEEHRLQTAAYYSWNRVAAQMREVITMEHR
ncbi:MAG: glycosyltransferase family 4 protein [Candidatus Kapabacteria bacterium]|jgi:glycosyltransferase involved in cell wall biosynthesis|nr:glycosyltransferase family 4 protein [Candidatus Kapabacteria bacterium]